MTMTTPTSISVRTSLGFEECLHLLRQKLHREELRIVAQIELHREFKRALGLGWRKHTVLVVWNSFYAYQALLCGEQGGRCLFFNVSVSEDAGATLIATLNHTQAGSRTQRPVGIQILERELDRKMEQIFMEFAVYETSGSRSALADSRELV